MTSPVASDTPAKYSQKYSIATRVFHWIGALLILLAFIAINIGDDWIGVHKSIGASFLIWTILRIFNRFASKAPPYLPMPKWQTAVAHLTHLGLYLTMLAMPISGMLMSMYGGRGVSVFGLFDIPAFVTPNRDMSRLFNEIHGDVIFPIMAFMILAHVGAALYHQFVMKDNLLTRMK